MNIALGLAVVSLATVAASRFFDSWNRNVYDTRVDSGEDSATELDKNRQRKSTFDWSLFAIVFICGALAIYSAWADKDVNATITHLKVRTETVETTAATMTEQVTELKAQIALNAKASEKADLELKKQLRALEAKLPTRQRGNRKERK